VGGKCDILVFGRKVSFCGWEKSEILLAVGGKCHISVYVRKVCILWCEESDTFWAVGGKCVFYGGMKMTYFGRS